MNTKRSFFEAFFAKIFLRNLTFAFGLLFFGTTGFAAVVLDQQFTAGATPNYVGGTCGMQTFRPGMTAPLESIDLQINSSGTNTATFTLINGTPSAPGAIIGSVNVTVPSGTNWVKFKLPFCGPTLNAGAEYHIKLTGNLDWLYSTSGSYPNGNMFQCPSNPYPSYDQNFKTYMYNGGCIGPIAGSNQAGVIANTASAPLGVNTSGDGGVWSTTGSGTFLNSTDPNTTYTPSCSEMGTTVTLTWTSCCNASLSCTQTITVAPPSFTVSSATVCAGQSATLSATGASTYSWSTGATTASINVSPGTTTTYTVTGTLSNSCVVSLISTVTVNSLPIVSSSNASICSGGSATLIASATGGSGGGYSYAWYNAATGGTLLASTQNYNTGPLIAGTYQYFPQVTDAVGCVSTRPTITVTSNPLATMTSASSVTICSGQTVGLNFSASPAPSSFSWLTNNNANTTGESTTPQTSSSLTDVLVNTVTTPQTLNYTVTPTHIATGCVGTAQTVTVTVNPTPVMTSASNTTVCSGVPLSFGFTSNVASTFSWVAGDNANTTGESTTSQSGSILNNTIVSSSAVAENVSYTVTPTSSLGCVGNSQNVIVIVNPLPTMTSGNSNTVCSGLALNHSLTSDISSTYSWIATDNINTTGESLTSQSSPTINNTITNATGSAQSVTYNVSPTSTTGSCVGALQVVTITVNPLPVITIGGGPVLCNGGTATLTASGASTYTWNPGGLTGSSQVLSAGSYTINGTSAVGCNSSTTHVLTQPPLLSASNSFTNVSCNGGSNGTITTSPAGGVAPYQFSLDGAAFVGTSNFTGLVAGTHTVTVKDNNNCTVNVISTINEPPVLTVSLSGTNVSCFGGTNGSISSTPSGGSGPYQFSLNGAPFNTPALFTGLAAGTYTVNVKDNFNCISAPVTININQPVSLPSITIGGNSTVCTGTALGITLSASGGTAGYNFGWLTSDNTNTTGESTTNNTGALINDIITNNTINNESLTYTVTVVDANGCSANNTAVASIFPKPSITSGSAGATCSDIPFSTNILSNIASTYTWLTTDNASTTGESTTSQSGSTLAQTISNLTAVNQTLVYTITPTATVSGCVGNPQSFTLTVRPLPSVSASITTNPLCVGGSTTFTASGTNTYVWNPATDLSSTTGASVTYNASTSGSFNYTVTGTNTLTTCSNTATITVNVNPIPTAPVPGSNSPVCTGSSLILDANTIGGATYNWTGPSAFTSSLEDPTPMTATAPMAGTYSLSVTVSGCTSPVATTNVIINTTPIQPTPGSNSPVCSGNNLNLFSDLFPGGIYSWTGPLGFTDASQNPSIPGVSVGAAGTYSLNVTVNGCTSPTATVSTIVNATPAMPSPSSTSPVCLGSNTAFNTATIGGAMYDWDFGDGNTSVVQNPTYSYTTVGSYTATLIVTLSGCPSAPGSVVSIVDDTPLAPVLGSNSPICEGSDLNLTATSAGAITYNWTGPNAFASTSQNPTITAITLAGAGTYTATASIGVCTSPTSTIIITVNPGPAAPVVGSNSPVCGGGTLSLNSSPSGGTTPYSFSWTGPNSFASTTQNPVVSTSAVLSHAGTYTLDVSDANGCTASATTNVIINPRPNFNIVAPATICSNYHLNLNIGGLTGGSIFNYNWTGPNAFSSPLANPIRNNVSAADGGNYSLQISNEFGCSFTDNFAVSVILSPMADITGGPNVVCANEFASLTGSTSTANGGVISGYQWIFGGTSVSGATLVNFPANNPGNYFLEVTNSNGCVDTSLAYVLGNKAIPVPVITGNNSFCTGTSSVLDGNTSTAGGVSTITSYQWSLNGTAISGATSVAYPATTGGNYELIIFNSNGCTDTSVVFFLNELLPPSPPVITSSGTSYCLNDSLLMSVQTPTAGHGYSWSVNPATVSVGTPSNTSTYIGGQATGTYTVSVIETDLNGCISNPGTSIITINALPLASVIPPANTTICYNGSVTVGLSTVSGAVSYDWTSSFGAVFNNTQNPTFTSITQTGLVQLYGTVTDANGCTSLADSVGIVVSNPLPAPTISSGGAICEGQSLSLFASPVVSGATYLWTDPFSATQSGVDLSSIVIPLTTVANAGPYTVSYMDANGCASQTSANFSETINPSPVVSISGATSFCVGGSTVLNASTSVGVASAYQWYLSGSVITGATSASYTASAGGDYTVEITLTTGCTGMSNITTVVVNALPMVSINPVSITICEGSAIVLSASGASSYNWGNGSTTASVSVAPVISSSFTVTGVDVNGCSNSDTAFVSVNPKPATPTASISTPATCAGTSVTLGSSSALANNWFNVATSVVFSNLQSLSHTETVSGTYNYGLYITDANSCSSDTSYVNITFNNCLSVLNDEIEFLQANGSVTNNIFTNDGNPAGYTVNTSPVLNPFNGSFTINSSGAYTYTPNAGFSGYDIVVVSACNASFNCLNDTIFISVGPYAGTDIGTVSSLVANAQLTGNVLVNDIGSGIAGSVVLITNVAHGTLTISPSGDFVYVPVANYCGPDSFMYRISDVNAFTANGYCIIDVSCTVEITTPSGFSPNNDGVNDVWVIAGIDANENRVTIYDRWGNEIWFGANYNNTTIAWNGKNKNNEELTAGTYFYMIEIKGKKAVRGWIEITK